MGAAARMGNAGMSPPNTVKALNVANPICALEPTATAAAPSTTLGRYSSDSRVRLSCPNNEPVMPYRSCMVPQCTISDPATTAQDRASSAATPNIAGRTASRTQRGAPRVAFIRGPAADQTPITAPRPCTRATDANARSAFGVCNSVMTDAASWMIASATAARNSGPPTAEAMIHRIRNQDPRAGVTWPVVRAVAHTINPIGSRGRAPSCWPAIEIGTPCMANHRLATAPAVPVRSLLATTNWVKVIAAMTTTATSDGPNAARTKSRDCAGPGATGARP